MAYINDADMPKQEMADRHNEGKLPVHLVPPDAIKAMAEVLEYGANRYSARNWEKGAKFSTPYASLMRHLMAFWQGEDLDSGKNGSGLPHLYHVIMNAAMLIRYYEKHKHLDDRPKSNNINQKKEKK